MSELYRLFAEGLNLDFSDEALLSLYNHESYGTDLSPKNGFAVGKRYLNLQVTMWREDIRNGTLSKRELYEDPLFTDKHWWLDSVLRGVLGTSYTELLNECYKSLTPQAPQQALGGK